MSLLYSLIASSALAWLAIYKRALTPTGTVLAWIICVVVCCFGGFSDFAIMTAVLVFTVAADKLAGDNADPRKLRRKSGRRDAVRVLCNVGMGGLAILLFAISGRRTFEIAYAAVMAESLADSLASKIGPISKRAPMDICTFKAVAPGLSGGISPLGTSASLLGALAVGTIFFTFGGSLREVCVVIICGFSGATLDSIFGSLLQGKYRCTVCGAVTEREVHCEVDTLICSGYRHINNDTVNFMSNASTLLLVIAVQLFRGQI